MMNFPDAPTNMTQFNPTSDARYTYYTADAAWRGGPGHWIVDDEAPMDGEPYARTAPGQDGLNLETGAWVRSGERTVYANLNGQQSIFYAVPATARLLRVTVSINHSNITNYTIMQVSFDGSTVEQLASDYQQAGCIIWSGTTAWQQIAVGNTSTELLYNSGDQNGVLPGQAEALVMVERPLSTKRASCFAHGDSLYAGTVYGESTSYCRSHYNAAKTNLRITNLYFRSYSGAWGNGTIVIEELT